MNKKENITRGPIAWMTGHSVAANLLMLVLIIGGILCALKIKKEVFGDFEMDWIMVSVSYPGASPEEVEQGIILAIEESVQSLDNVSEISSSANEGVGTVTIEMLTSGDLQKLTQDVKSAVERITSFPKEAEEPQISTISPQHQVLTLVVYGDQEEWVLRQVIEDIRYKLLNDPDIVQVELSSIRDYELSIEVPQAKLRAYNLTLQEIADTVRAASVEVPGGSIKADGGEILIRMAQRKGYAREFAQIPIIAAEDGSVVRLEDIAVVSDGFEETDHCSTYNGKPAAMVNVYRVGDQTPIEVSEAVMRYVNEWRGSLPPGIEIEVLNDMSEMYAQRLDLLVRNGYLGLILVFGLLALFLEPRLAFWVTMGIPISFLGAFFFLPRFGVTLNMNSMFAFIVALGIVVDDAIVVGENIYKFHSQGDSFLTAAVKGVREVSMPVTFAVLTNIATFMPLCFVPGFMGKMFFAIPIVVISVIGISLIESLFILPAHIGHLRDRCPWGPIKWLFHFQQKFSLWFSRLIEKVYGPFLRAALRFRYVTLCLGLVMIMITLSFIISGRMGITLMERVESDFAQVTATLPYGTAVEKTKAVQDILVSAAQKVAEDNGGSRLVKGIFAEVGVTAHMSGEISGGHTTQVRVFLTAPEKRPIEVDKFVELWRKNAGEIPGLESLLYKSDAGGPGSMSALTLELSHPDIDVLIAAGEDLAAALANYPMVSDIDDGFQPGKQQRNFAIRPEGRALGLSAQDVANQVRNAFYGTEVFRQQRERNEVTVIVRLPASERASEYNLEELMIRTPAGTFVPLGEIVDVTRGRAFTSIERENGRRLISVTAEVQPRPLADMILKSLKEHTLPGLLEKYPDLEYGAGGMQEDMTESMTNLVMGLGLALLMIYALLAIPFRSYIQPVIIMSSIPFGIIGAILGHLLLGYSLSLMSLFGMVALTGVVVNDSLVLIDFTNRERIKGLSPFDALVSAGISRFRPIMLTSLTTFGALVPMIFETSLQARFMIPMAISLGFGVLFATFITLILVPCIYHIIEDLHGLITSEETGMIPMDVNTGVDELITEKNQP
ncbi:MAG: efflux RND transporter permease subunit [Deltaproteobacteria bacterium]|nr:efflux RND transporter permease subunit [Deltaproteobacteria bacterium]